MTKPVVLERPIEATRYPLDRPRHFIAEETLIREIPPGHCVVAPTVVTLCASERHYYSGQKRPEKLAARLPMCLGHEAVGRIVHSGNSECFSEDDYVLLIPLNPCGECPACKRKQENLCSHAKFMASTCDGALQTAFCYPEKLLRHIPNAIDADIASLIEPVSIGYRAVKTLQITRGKQVAIVGAGPMGSILALAVFWFGFGGRRGDLSVCDIKHESLAGIRKLKIAETIDTTDHPKMVRDLTGSRHVSFEAVGKPESIQQAVDLSKPNGHVGILGLNDGSITVYGANDSRLDIPVLTDFVNRGERKELGKRTLVGCSRSLIRDYDHVLNELSRSRRLRTLLHGLLSEDYFVIEGVEDLIRAFEQATFRAGTRKTTLFLNGHRPSKPRVKLA